MPDTDRENDPQRNSLTEYRIKQLENRLERDAKEARDSLDRCVRELKQHYDEELKDLRETNEKRFSRLENFIIRALVLVATPVVVGIIALVIKNPPS